MQLWRHQRTFVRSSAFRSSYFQIFFLIGYFGYFYIANQFLPKTLEYNLYLFCKTFCLSRVVSTFLGNFAISRHIFYTFNLIYEIIELWNWNATSYIFWPHCKILNQQSAELCLLCIYENTTAYIRILLHDIFMVAIINRYLSTVLRT